MQGERAVEKTGMVGGDCFRDPPRRQMTGRAGRRAGAGRDMGARVARFGDEAERACGLSQFGTGLPCQAKEQQCALWRRADLAGTARDCLGCEPCDCLGRHRTEGQGDAENFGRIGERENSNGK